MLSMIKETISLQLLQMGLLIGNFLLMTLFYTVVMFLVFPLVVPAAVISLSFLELFGFVVILSAVSCILHGKV